MTSITFGGGPDIETRRKFSNLKDGSLVPGYQGYVHQLKYNSGHTYGDTTHELRGKLERHKTTLGFGESGGPTIRWKPLHLRNSLPKSNGTNRLTESMVPGYTGYVPARKFAISATYKNECDECVDDFLDARQEKANKIADLLGTLRSQTKLVPIAGGDDLSEKLAVKNNELFTFLPNDKRKVTEAPMPGYTGYVPKIGPTELGLGARYHVTAEKGFRAFERDYRRFKSTANFRSLSFEPESVEIGQQTGENLSYLDIERKSGDRRIFVKPGMIPQYTGYVHGRRYVFGNTYGETTRQLPVCAHNANNFGEYMRTLRGTKTFIC